MAGLPRSTPFVAEAHTPPSNDFQHLWHGRLFARSGFRRLVVISAKLKRIYAENFPAIADRIVVAHDAADDPSPEILQRPHQAGFHVGYVGHLYRGRGGDLIKSVAAALPEFTFHIVGGTEGDRASLIATGPTSNLIVHGHKPHSRLAEFFPLFDVVLAPYQHQVAVSGGGGDISAVMSPMKLFEYMSWGKPILCSDLPVLREIIEHERNGILLPPDDVCAWIAAIRDLAENRRKRERLGAAARSDFLARHTWPDRARRVLEALEPGSTAQQT
jgi:glycosyltransferase involved in cell wall biosynthesis